MKFRLIALTVLVSVSGCYSFNYIQLAPREGTPKRVITPEPIKTPPVDEKTNEVKCAPYALPELPKLPDLPLKELEKIDPRDSLALDQLQRQHIEDLRQYGIRLKQSLRASYNDYLTNCYTINGLAVPSELLN